MQLCTNNTMLTQDVFCARAHSVTLIQCNGLVSHVKPIVMILAWLDASILDWYPIVDWHIPSSCNQELTCNRLECLGLSAIEFYKVNKVKCTSCHLCPNQLNRPYVSANQVGFGWHDESVCCFNAQGNSPPFQRWNPVQLTVCMYFHR